MRADTQRFLELMNRQNEAIARMEAENKDEPVESDPVRLQRDQERREKWGELRAREHPSRRPHRVRSIFPFSDLS
jgi:hypothetical protein